MRLDGVAYRKILSLQLFALRYQDLHTMMGNAFPILLFGVVRCSV